MQYRPRIINKIYLIHEKRPFIKTIPLQNPKNITQFELLP